MAIVKGKKRIIRNSVLVSLMAFYFSCGKDVFPPDSPGEMTSQRNTKTAATSLAPSPPTWGRGLPASGGAEGDPGQGEGDTRDLEKFFCWV
jgi:hypothetical protein